jgi:glycosyltransferase involved in cell wall biosynthesis
MRILSITNDYPPHAQGGYGEIAADMMSTLAQRGHDVCVLTRAEPGPDEIRGARVVRRLGFVPGVWRRPVAGLRVARGDQPLLRELLAEGWDVCVAWHLRGILKTNLRLIHDAGIPVLYQLHDRWVLYERPGSIHVPWARLDRLGAARARELAGSLATRVTGLEMRAPPIRDEGTACFTSHWLEDWYREAGWVPARAEQVPCGVDLARFAAPPRPAARPPETALYAGRVEPRKGLDVALRALAASRSRLRLTIAGPPDDLAYLEQMRALATELGLADRARFAGELPREAIVAELGRHDVLLYPSTGVEAYSLGLIEGLAAGCVVVTSAPGGPREYLEPDRNSLVFAPGDVAALTRALDALEDDPALAERLRAGAAQTAQALSLAVVVDKLERLLVQAAAA